MSQFQSTSVSTAIVKNVTSGIESGPVSASASATGFVANDTVLLSEKLSIEYAIQLANKLVSTPDEKVIITDTHTESAVTVISDTITLYYLVKILVGGVYVANGAETNNVTDNGEYSGYSSFFSSFKNGDFDKTTVINYSGYRTPAKAITDLPPYFDEIINILRNDGFITATKIYEDSGSGTVTTVPFNTFVVTGASGIYEGYKSIKISYYPDYSRTVEISK